MPYINHREEKAGFAMIETIRQNFEGYTKKEIAKSGMSGEVQG